MDSITKLFFELIQITLGNRDGFSRMPSGEEWEQLYLLSQKHSLTSLLLEGVNKVKNGNHNVNVNDNHNHNHNVNENENDNLDQRLVFEWIGVRLQTESSNKVQNQRAKEICQMFKESGFRGCVLKGQGTALYYPHPEYRQCGDIDFWVDGDRDVVLNFARKKGWKIGHIDIKHSDMEIFEDVPVEVHFLPSWMYCPSTNRRLQKFFEKSKEREFTNWDESVGFVHTTVDFDLVYSMVHIYRHIFSEGIGQRQLMDYYMILRSVKSEELRAKSFEMLCSLRMRNFVGGIMWILRECFGMEAEYLLCPVNKQHGEFLLSEIMTAGNFGQYDERTKQVSKDKKFKRGFVQLGRNLRFVSYYPSEVLWSPFWKLWHWVWRKKKGYL